MKEKAEQTVLWIRDVCLFPVVRCKDDSPVNSADVILLDEQTKYPEVIALAPISMDQLVNTTKLIQNIS